MDLKQLLQQTTIKTDKNHIEHDTNGADETMDEPINDTITEPIDEPIDESMDKPIDEPIDEPITEPIEESSANSEVEETIDPRFAQPWNKLEKGMKLNRFLVFIENETKDKQLTDIQSQALKQLLFKGCDMGLFNKINDVKYNSETGIIESVKQLEFNDTSHKYKLKTGGSKGRSVSKSRSNIDRLMKK